MRRELGNRPINTANFIDKFARAVLNWSWKLPIHAVEVMKKLFALSMSLLVATIALPAFAQTYAVLNPLSGFGPRADGTLVPGDRSYITTGSFQRGISYNPTTGNLIFIDRQAGGGGSSNITGSIYILNGLGGEIEITAGINGTLSTNGMSGGNFADMAVAVADDGVIYVGNVVNDGTAIPFKLYRWDSEASTADPVVVFSGDPGNGRPQRWGDTMDIRGSGTGTQIILGTRTISGIPGTNVAILTTTDGINFAATTLGTDVRDSASGGGIAFGTGNTFWAKNVDVPLRQFSFDLTTSNATTLRSYGPNVLAASRTLEPLAVDTSADILAIVDMTSGLDRVRLYDISNAANPPALLDIKDFPVNNANGTTTKGYLDFAFGRLYVHNMNNGIMAFSVDSAFLTSPTIITQPASQRVLSGRMVILEVLAYPAATYQWQRNGVDISGATHSAYTITNVQPSHAGTYRVIVSNSAGSVTSDEATLNVVNIADLYHLRPVWSKMPATAVSVTNYATSSGGANTPNERNIAYNPVLDQLYVQQRDGTSARYAIHVVNAVNGAWLYTLKTNGIFLNVPAFGGATGIAIDAIGVGEDGAIYAANMTADACGCRTNTGVFRVYRWANSDSNTLPVQVYQGEPTGQSESLRWGDVMSVRGSGTNTQILLDNHNPQTGARYMAILRPTDATMTTFAPSYFFQDATTPFGNTIGRSLQFGEGDTLWQKRKPTATVPAALVHSSFDPDAVFPNNVAPVIATYPNFPITLGQVAVDLTRNIVVGINHLPANSTTPDTLDIFDFSDPNAPFLLAQYNFPINHQNNANVIGGVLIAGDKVFALDGNNGIVAFRIVSGPQSPPTILTQPRDMRVVESNTITLSVLTADMASFQWQFNGVDIFGATTATYTIPSATTNHAGPYRVIVSNDIGATTSVVATVTVLSAANFARLSPLWSLAPEARPYLPRDGNAAGQTPLYRGIAYNPLSNQVYIISRTDQTSLIGLTINVLDASTGDDLYRLNTSTIIEGTSSIILLGMGVGEDGALYAANMAELANNAAFNYNLYRWANSDSNTAPVLVYSGDPGAGITSRARWGDTLDVRGAGIDTEIIVDANTGAHAAIFKPFDDAMNSFLPTAFAQNYGGGSIGRSLQYGTSNTFWQKRKGARLLLSSFDLTAPSSTVLSNFVNFPSSLGPVAVDLSRNLLAGIDFSTPGVPDTLALYDTSDLNNPLLIARYPFPVNQQPNGNFIGQVVFAGNRIFAVNGNNGVAAFDILPPGGSSPTLTITREGSNVILSWPSSATGFILQKTASLSAPDWQPVDTGGANMTTENANAGNAYYRLRRP